MVTLTAHTACVSDWSAAPEDVRAQIAALESFIGRLSSSSPWLRPGAERRLSEARAHLARLEGDAPITDPPRPVDFCEVSENETESRFSAAPRAQVAGRLCRAIDQARLDLGLSIEALAERTGLAAPSLRVWLDGAAGGPLDVDALQKVAQALGLRVELVSAAPGASVAA